MPRQIDSSIARLRARARKSLAEMPDALYEWLEVDRAKTSI